MNTRFTALALALATFATLGTACDSEPTSSSDELSFRGDVLDPPPPTTGGIIIVKGGHDNPWEILTAGFDHAPIDYQLAFLAECEKPAHLAIEDEFLSGEHIVEQCTAACGALEMHWEGGVAIRDLRFEHGTVTTESGKEEGDLYWQTELRIEAQTSCGCV